MLSSVLYVLFSTTVEAHSWIQCTDYRGDINYYDNSKCFGHVRPWQRGNNDFVSPNQVAFGVDQGFNKLMHETPDGQCNTLIDDQFRAGNFPMATYKRGQTVTLAWPAKNHVPENCDNNPGGAGLPDTFNGLYMENYVPGLRINYNREVVFEPMTEGNTHQRGQIDYKGFGKCPKFCENRDKALCTGQFVVPNVPDGRYSFSWRWEFNGGRNPPERYVTCFEAEVRGEEIKPVEGSKWDQGGVGMFVERNSGCNDHTDENKCLSYADGRDGRVGERCGWCCGESCRTQGVAIDPNYEGGENRCEPISWLEENGITRWRTEGVDNCQTFEPTPAPTETPTESPTQMPTESPTAQPSEMPTEAPTEVPTQMMAPNPAGPLTGGQPGAPQTNCIVGPTGPVSVNGQCGGEGFLMDLCCETGANCVVLSPFFSQCQQSVAAAQQGANNMMPWELVLIVVGVVFCIALCCGTLLVYKLCISKDSGDSYVKHNSLSDRDQRSRYDDKHERRRKKESSRRSRDRSESPRSRRKEKRSRRDSRSPRRTPRRTDSGGSWVEEN